MTKIDAAVRLRVGPSGFLAPYKVLDLTDHRGVLAGHMLAQLGADVVQMESREGSSARQHGPFADAWPPRENSLYWAAYASGKRSIVCEPDQEPALWQQLVDAADFVIDSTAPAEGRPPWIAPDAVASINPRAVHVSITPFGLTGPKSAWADSEITLWAAGGPLLLTRNLVGHPIRISVPQAYLHGAATAAGAALIAHAARLDSGVGQHVDLSVQQCLPQCTLGAMLAGSIGHDEFVPRPTTRGKGDVIVDLSGSGSVTRRSKWIVADGLAEMHLAMGPATGPSTNRLFQWMRETGAIDDRFADWDWTTLHKRLRAGEINNLELEEARHQVAAFVARFRKRDLMDIALARGVRIAPIETIADLAASPQFAARGFIKELDGSHGRYQIPGAFARGCDAAFVDPQAAPCLGADTAAVADTWQPNRAMLPPPAGETGRAPLAGVKVLDLAWVVAGPLIGRNMADFGATVVRVESSKRVETARLMGPFPGGKFDIQQSALYETCNAGKLGLSLDLSKPEARAVVRDLVRWADVLIESFTPGQMAKWELSYEELELINPSLVMMSTSLTGQSGPYALYSGYGNHGAAIAGFQNIVGMSGDTPVGPYGPYTDFVAPRFGLVAMLAALDWRKRTGQGCFLDVSQTEAGVQFLGAQIADFSVTGKVHTALGNRDAQMAPHGVYPTAGDDNWIAIAVRTDDEWKCLLRLIGNDSLEADRRFDDLAGRKRFEDEVDAAVATWTARSPSALIEELLQQASIPAHRLTAPEDFAEDAQIVFRNALLRIPHAISGEAVIEATPFKLSKTSSAIVRSAPPFGRDNEAVLVEILGYDPDKIASLAAANALR